MLTVLMLCAAAQADVSVPQPDGMQAVDTELRVEGLAGHPDVALVVYDPGETIDMHVTFTAEGPDRQRLARGGNNRGAALGKPGVFLLPLDAAKAWEAASTAVVEKQRSDCEQGIGCAHISRFAPSYPAPRGAVSCGVELELKRSGPIDGPDTLVQVLALTEATTSTCTLEVKATEHWKGELMLGPIGTGSKGGSMGGCATVTGAASVVTGLLLLLGLVPRRRR